MKVIMNARRSTLRSQTGSILVLVAACLLIFAAIGIAFYLYSRMAIGSNEVRNAVDTVAVAVAQDALKINVPLKDDGSEDSVDETLVFGGCTDKTFDGTNKISLLTYNRVVGKALQIAMNADETVQYGDGTNSDGRTQAVETNAQNVFKAAQDMGGRLRAELQNSSNFRDAISVGKGNTTALASAANNGVVIDQFEAGYMFPARASNLIVPDHLQAAIDNDRAPSSAGHYEHFTINTIKGNGLLDGDDHFLTGYQDNWVNQVTKVTGELDHSRDSVLGVPLAAAPHIISQTDFDNSTKAQLTVPDMKAFAVPNAFKITAHTKEQTTGQSLSYTSAALAGCRNKTYSMSMPDAYLVVYIGNGGAEPTTLLNYFDTCEFGTYVRQFVFPNNAQGSSVDPVNPHNGETANKSNVRTETMYLNTNSDQARLVYQAALNWSEAPSNFGAAHVSNAEANQDVYGQFNAGPAPENQSTPQQEFTAFISDRLQQMNPTSGATDAITLLNWQPPQQNAFYLVYYDDNGTLNKAQIATDMSGRPDFSTSPIRYAGAADGMLREYFNAQYSDGFQASSGANRCLGAVSVNCRTYSAQMKNALNILNGTYSAATTLTHRKDY